MLKSKEKLVRALEKGVQVVDLRFTDLLGGWQHFSIPVEELSEELFTEGIGFDGSSIVGFQEIHESDMILVPDMETMFIDPLLSPTTLVFICDVVDPITRQPYSRDPRAIAKKAEKYLRESGIADISFWGPEVEFFIFSNVHYQNEAHRCFYEVDSEEGIWNSATNSSPNLGHRPRFKGGYFPTPPIDRFQELRSKMVKNLLACGIRVEAHHHEVATAGQGEIDLRYAPLTKMGDNVMIYKYVVKNTAHQYGLTATFMPKPLFGDNASGMHTHQSLWKEGQNLFFSPNGYAYLSQLALWYIGGLLKHAPALLSFCAPTTNSYRRLVPGYEAPVNLVYSQRNRSACIRIPMYSANPSAKRIEFRPPDPSANPYLAFAAMLMAGIDGIINQIDPGEPYDIDLYKLAPDETREIKSLPSSLHDALKALEEDHEFLLRGGVFTEDVIDKWLELKWKEADEVALRPHPYEFYLYYSV
ncbi:type I glutamate--ammonia ligase [bacterium]|nr:type I glutamate--ammonia ligase [bacterium]